MGRLVHLVVDSAVTLGRGNRLRLMITRFLQLLFQLGRNTRILVLV
jgi:hypothetical protein